MRSRALIDSVHDWTPSREDSDIRSTSCDNVSSVLAYMVVLSHNREAVASEGVRTLKYETDGSYEPTDGQPVF